METSQELARREPNFATPLVLGPETSPVQNPNRAAIYLEAGLDEVGLLRASDSVANNYADFASHLFLAETLDSIQDFRQINSRFDLPAANEYFIANVLAPVGAGPISPTISRLRYGNILEKDHVGFTSSSLYLSDGEWVQHSSLYGTAGSSAFAIEASYRQQNGPFEIRDPERSGLAVQIKQQITSKDMLLLLVDYKHSTSGDLSGIPTLQYENEPEPTIVLAYTREWSPTAKTILALGRQVDSSTDWGDTFPFLLFDGHYFPPLSGQEHVFRIHQTVGRIYTAELQQIWRLDDHQFIVGARGQLGNFFSQTVLELPDYEFAKGDISSSENFTVGFDRLSLYAFDLWHPLPALDLTLGGIYEQVQYPANFRNPPLSNRAIPRERTYPKLGLAWTPVNNLTFRAAYSRSLGAIAAEDSFRLEPTQVGGFNQSYRSLLPTALFGSQSTPAMETYDFGVDLKLAANTFVGVEGQISNSENDANFGILAIGQSSPFQLRDFNLHQKFTFHERSFAMHVNQLIGEDWSAGVRYRWSPAKLQYRVEGFDRNFAEREGLLQRAEFFVLFNHPCGAIAGAEAEIDAQLVKGNNIPDFHQSFWQVNTFAGYRFPRRKAEIRMTLLNATGLTDPLSALNYHVALPRNRILALTIKLDL